MSDERKRVTHPSWCDRDLCTAPEFQPTLDEYRGSNRIGAHLSAPVTTHGMRGELQLSLWQGVTAWETNTFLAIECEGETVASIGLGDGQGGIELYALLGMEVKELVGKYPALYAERFPYVQRAIEDEADEATADAVTPRDPVELEDQMAAEAHAALGEVVQARLAEERKAKGCTHPADEPCFGKTRKALYPMSYRLTVNGKTDRHPTFPELRAAVADLVTRRLAVEPERVAGEAQSMNAMFTDGTVQQALDERAEWFTVFDAYGEEPLRIRVTAERD